MWVKLLSHHSGQKDMVLQMFLNPDETMLRGDDIPIKGVVLRVVKMSLCRCRECNNKCKRLHRSSCGLCVYCNNYHSQRIKGKYMGPYKERDV